MGNRTGCSLIIWCAFMLVGAYNATAQSSKSVESPFTMILVDAEKSNITTDKPLRLQKTQKSLIAQKTQRKPLNSISGRRLGAGVRASEYVDGRGGRITVSGLSTEGDANADKIIYQISARSKHAQNLRVAMQSRYGEPDEVSGGERIWYISNPDIRRGQAKIITMRLREVSGDLVITADRTPITRRGELLVKSKRKSPNRNKASSRNTGKPATAAQQKQIQPHYSID